MEFRNNKTKSILNLCTIGPKSSGKSTLVGQLLYQFGAVDDATLLAVERIARNFGNERSKFAFLVDRTEYERRAQCSTESTLVQLKSVARSYSLLDGPGDNKYVKHLLSCISQADVALLVLSCDSDVDEIEQMKEHAVLSYTLGVQKLVICINQMDTIDYSEKKFNDIKATALENIVKIGFKDKKTIVIPMSAYTGENVVETSENFDWYKGPTLYEALEIYKTPKRDVNKSLRMVIHRRFFIENEGTIVVGKVEFGKIYVGMKIRIQPANVMTTVASIEYHQEAIEEATCGMIVGVCLGDLVPPEEISRGSVISHATKDFCKPVRSFVGQIILLGGPAEFKRGYRPVVCAHGLYIPCRVSRIISRFDKGSRDILEHEPEKANPGDGVMCELIPNKACVVEEFSKFASLGRFAMRDSSGAVAVGVVKSPPK